MTKKRSTTQKSLLQWLPEARNRRPRIPCLATYMEPRSSEATPRSRWWGVSVVNSAEYPHSQCVRSNWWRCSKCFC